MLENYFWESDGREKSKRLIAVQAALEIAKSSVSASSSYTGVKTGADLDFVAEKIEALADALQKALEK